jgi:hypothetical protein
MKIRLLTFLLALLSGSTILGRVGNLSEAEIWKAWQSGNREAFVKTVLEKIKVK